jgi:two-component sensor histidine kinase
VTTSLKNLHRFWFGAAVLYLVCVAVVGFAFLQLWHHSEQIAAQSRSVKTAASRLALLATSPVSSDTDDTNWLQDMENIHRHFHTFEAVGIKEGTGHIHALLHEAERIFTIRRSLQELSQPDRTLADVFLELIPAIHQFHEDTIVARRQVSMHRTFAALALAGGLLALLMLTGEILLYRCILDPVARLQKTVTAYGNDNAIRAGMSGIEEIDVLAQAINQTTAIVEQQSSALKHELAVKTQQEAKIQAALQEKETLLREIHHRVKNNMQVVVSLLGMSAHQAKDPRSAAIIQECLGRIDAMSLVHETLYKSSNLRSIDFAQYLAKLTDNISRTYNTTASRIELSLQTDPIELDADRCIDMGLILTELLTNALKYAFQESPQDAVVCVSLVRQGEDLELCVADNGTGIRDTTSPEASGSFGLRLVRGIIERNFAGSMQIQNQGGTRIVMRFPQKMLQNQESEDNA